MFIPDGLLEGDTIELTRNMKVFGGTFTKGHRFLCIGIGDRGPDFEDDDGNCMLETGLENNFYKIIPTEEQASM